MSVSLQEPLGVREVQLPLTIGDDSADVPIPGITGVALRVQEHAGQWWVHVESSHNVRLNGLALSQAVALTAADVLQLGGTQLRLYPEQQQIRVTHEAGNATVAPAVTEFIPGEEFVPGVREVIAAGTATTGGPAGAAVRAVGARGISRWLAGAALAAVVLVAAWTVFRLVPVELQITPSNAAVDADGWFDWRIGDRLFVMDGQRRFAVSHPEYQPQELRRAIARSADEAPTLKVALQKLPGVLQVDTGGVSGELLDGGKVVGAVPGAVTLAAGKREVLIRAARHVDYIAQVDVAGGGRQQALQVKLLPAYGWLVLDSQPSNARIMVDGKDKGQAPQRLELDAGVHALSIAGEGRRAWSSEVVIVAGQTLDLGRIDLATAAATPRLQAAAVSTATPSSVVPLAPAAAGESPSAPSPVAAAAPPPARTQSGLVGTLILFPAGSYQQGSERREQGRRSNESLRQVTLTRPFYLAEREVSNAQFRSFRGTHAAGIALDKSLELDRQAVSGVTWSDAVEFCNWLSLREGLPVAYERQAGRWQLIKPYTRGYRLPTEAEWEYAARYVDGRQWARFAWGNALPPPAGAANLAGSESLPKPGPDARLAKALPDYADEHPVIAPVGSYQRSAAGVYDLGGNVSEWTHDVYLSLLGNTAVEDPMGGDQDGAHVIRGANWRTAAIADLRLAWRDRGESASQVVGFRVARFAGDAQ